MYPPAEPAESSTRTRPGRGLRVGLVLLLVAAVPVAGVAGLTVHGIDGARSREQHAARVATLVHDAVELTKLDAAVFEELVWAAVDVVAATIGAPPEVIAAFSDEAPADALAAARARTDELLASVGHPSLATQVSAARVAGLERRRMADRYREVRVTVQSALAVVREGLASTPHGATGALPDALELLGIAVDTRAAVADEFDAYFSTSFDLRDAPAVEMARLIAARALFEDGLGRLEQFGRGSPELTYALEVLESDDTLHTFTAAVDALIAESISGGVPDRPPALTLATLSQQLDRYTSAYRAAADASQTAIALVDTVAELARETSSDDATDAHRAIVWWQLLAAALGAAALGSAVAASRYIVRPLRCLQRAATALQAGDGSTRCALTGPSEVRVAALALRDAAAHVELVARQADALASGDLDADVLDEPAPGGLGTALQQAVHNLRSALAQQEEFRRRLTHEASHDALTHLPNRNAALAQLARSLAHQRRTASQLAVLVVDIDRFNEVNDHHGHRGGDTVLSTIARRLVTTVRESDHVGRLGGDEFVVVAEPVSGPEEAMQLAERILAAIAEPIHLPHSSVRVQASVGIAVADSRLTADELIRDADLAVSRAKERGEGGIEVCNADLHAEIAEVAGMQVALRNAIDRDELVVHYQPIIDVHTARLHALEALVRWRRPGQAGLVPPDRFITIAERSSLVIDLDRWVVHAVARQLAEWADDPVLGTVPVAVNVSGRHLAHDHVVEQLLQPLAEVGVAPRRLVVEVTESALMGDLVRASTKLHRLRSAGMRIAIDDFGTGYTSLAHLRCLPVDVLKIDRSFSLNAVGSEHGASIVKLIIDAGHLLGATVTAEGIETEEEAARLTELGADHLQGFLYSRPLPPDDLAALHRHVAHLRG